MSDKDPLIRLSRQIHIGVQEFHGPIPGMEDDSFRAIAPAKVTLKTEDGGRILEFMILGVDVELFYLRSFASDLLLFPHDLLNTVITDCGAMVSKIVIRELKDDTLFVDLVLVMSDDSEHIIGCRIADAIHMLARNEDAEIFARESVIAALEEIAKQRDSEDEEQGGSGVLVDDPEEDPLCPPVQ